jgi:lipopolysaccharide transport system ATP-binding protein
LEVGTGFHPELTGRENIYLNGSLLGMKRAEIESKFDAIVAFAEVEQFLDTPVKRYSSGMYVRLAFAVAAHLEPEILIVDEVLAVGDATFQKKCLGQIQAVGRSGRTVIFVSHNADVVANLCTKVILMRRGRIHSMGATDDILLEYYSDAAESKTGVFDVTEHLGRPGHFKPWIRKVCLTDTQGRGCSHFVARDSLTLNLSIHPLRPLTDARVAVAIEDHLGRRLLTVANYQSGEQHWQLHRECSVTAVIQDLRLGTGRYMFSVSVSTQADGLLDSIDHCGWFDVEAVNCYGTGVPYHTVYGPVLETATWTLHS